MEENKTSLLRFPYHRDDKKDGATKSADIPLLQDSVAAAAVCPHAAEYCTQNVGFINDDDTRIPLSCTRIIIIIIIIIIICLYCCAPLSTEPRSKELSLPSRLRFPILRSWITNVPASLWWYVFRRQRVACVIRTDKRVTHDRIHTEQGMHILYWLSNKYGIWATKHNIAYPQLLRYIHLRQTRTWFANIGLRSKALVSNIPPQNKILDKPKTASKHTTQLHYVHTHIINQDATILQYLDATSKFHVSEGWHRIRSVLWNCKC